MRPFLKPLARLACLPQSRHNASAPVRGYDAAATRAFTLLEILVVLAIIGLLAGLAITNVDKIFGDAQGSTTRMQVRESMRAPLMSYRISMGDFPSTSEGLQALVTPPASKADRWRGPYVEPPKVPIDHWGEPLQYEYPGKRNKTSYDLWSKGPDKQTGTDDDIGNWDAATPESK
jgi:general secretion pathway protein G